MSIHQQTRTRWEFNSLLPSRLSEAPLHDFPYRDILLRQFFRFSPSDRVLEMGPGCGYTAHWLSSEVGRMTLVDISEATVADLKVRLSGLANVTTHWADVCEPGLAGKLPGPYDKVFALDAFEYVPKPDECLKNLAESLRPGGSMFLTFPNTPPPVGDGVTYFETADDLTARLRAAGFTTISIFGAKYNGYARLVFGLFHDLPLKAYRRLRNNGTEDLPQIYEATWAFQNRERLERIKPWVHLYWEALEGLLRLGGRVFRRQEAGDQLHGLQLVIKAEK